MTFDLVSLGRANLDLYSQDIGADFEDATGFDAMVGGSPTNIAIGVARLGLRPSLLTAVGDDRTGGFVLRSLRNEGVDTSHVHRIPGKLTSLALLGVKPPSDFPLSFYRDDPADIYLDPSVVEAFPFGEVRSAQVSGNALSRGPCAQAAVEALRRAQAAAVPTYMDLDLRPTEWRTPEAYGEAIRGAMPWVDVVLGTEEEFFAALMQPNEPLSHGKVPVDLRPALVAEIQSLLIGDGPAVAILKQGPVGAALVTADTHTSIPGFPVDVVNTVGAGDSFAAGIIRSRIVGLSWTESVRFANACGAIVVTRHGCSSAMPSVAEVEAFIAASPG